MNRINIGAAAFLAAMLAGCGQGSGPESGGREHGAAPAAEAAGSAQAGMEAQKEAPEAAEDASGAIVTLREALASEVGREATCPVMGSTFKVKADTQVAEYKGKAYYFCCPGCGGKFKDDPESYAKG
ncbi:MAG: YHS domain-containing protein [Elusimicrobiota bacterium]